MSDVFVLCISPIFRKTKISMRVLSIAAILLCLCLSQKSFSQTGDSTYSELLGKYRFAAGSVLHDVTITYENAALLIISTAGTSSLEKIKGDTFNIVSFSGIAVFKRDENKKINGVHIDAGGYVLDGVKDAPTGIIEATVFAPFACRSFSLGMLCMKPSEQKDLEMKLEAPKDPKVAG